jgi:branched-chain amino acid transport system substrate-binding protein
LVIGIASTLGATAQTSDTITIGYTGPLSGGAASYGLDVQRGLQMAIDEINADGGVRVGGQKRTFKLVSLDDQYRPPNSVSNAKQLVQRNGATIVFCPHSGGILAIMAFNDKSPKFVLGAYSSEPAIIKQNNTMTVMIPPSFDAYFKPYAQVEMKRFGKRLGLLATTTAYGNAWVKGFSAEWQAEGGTVLGNNSVDYNTTTDFSGAVSKTLADKPDVILVGGPSQPTGLVMKAARDQGFKGGFAIMDQAKYDQISQVLPVAGQEGSVGVVPFRDYPGNGTRTFYDTYTKKFGTSRGPSTEVSLNYEATHVLAEAIALANSTDPAAIMSKVTAAAKQVPSKYLPATIHGVSKAGHLVIDIWGAQVLSGKYVRFSIPFTE